MNQKVKFEYIEADNLFFDNKSSRLPDTLYGKPESEIINYYLKTTSLIELMLAIKKNGFFPGEQLLVVQDGENYKVIEGNRRLSAVKLIHNPGLATVYDNKVKLVNDESDYIPKELPCLVFNNKDEILKYLGFRHITGIKSWRLLEKARYVTKLRKDFFPKKDITIASREIAKMIGSRMDYVKRILVGYSLYEVIENNRFYDISGWDDTNFHFNYIADSLSRVNIAKYLGVDLDSDVPTKNINHDHLKDWTNWFFNKENTNKIIGDSEHLHKLNKVLASPVALEAFKNGEKLTKAIEFTDEINVQFENAIIEAINHLEKADSLSHKQEEFYVNLEEDLKNISRIIRKIKTVKDEVESGKLGL